VKNTGDGVGFFIVQFSRFARDDKVAGELKLDFSLRSKYEPTGVPDNYFERSEKSKLFPQPKIVIPSKARDLIFPQTTTCCTEHTKKPNFFQNQYMLY
jgi:hypothetical protein